MDPERRGKEQYRECMRNHAATLGTYATDGCGEYTPGPAAAAATPGGLQCAACGCHRNFHRKYYVGGGGGDSLVTGLSSQGAAAATEEERTEGKRRARTKFSAEQKEGMLRFAEKIGWKMQRGGGDDEISRFCREIGVSRQIFKVWMHNHKNSSSSSSSTTAATATTTTTTTTANASSPTQ